MWQVEKHNRHKIQDASREKINPDAIATIYVCFGCNIRSDKKMMHMFA